MDNPEPTDLAQEVQKLRDEVRSLRKRVRGLRKAMVFCTVGLSSVIVFCFVPSSHIFAAIGTLAVIFVALFFFDSTVRRIAFGWRSLDNLERKTFSRWTTLSAQWHQKHLDTKHKGSTPTE